ncbi:MAG TPA: hypothetical protein VGJ10_19925, partial [Paraburkholderia sp.]
MTTEPRHEKQRMTDAPRLPPPRQTSVQVSVGFCWVGPLLYGIIRFSREHPAMTKYVFVTGGVVSSLGKGIAAASLAAILESRGLK